MGGECYGDPQDGTDEPVVGLNLCQSPVTQIAGLGLRKELLKGSDGVSEQRGAGLTFVLFHLPSVVSPERYSKKFSASGWNTNKPLSPPRRRPSRTQLCWLSSGFYGKRNL